MAGLEPVRWAPRVIGARVAAFGTHMLWAGLPSLWVAVYPGGDPARRLR